MNNHAVVGAAIAWSQRVDAWWSCWAISQAQTCPRPGFRSRRGPASDHLLQNFAIRNGTARSALTTKPTRIFGQSQVRKLNILKSTLSIARMAGGRVRSRKVPQQAGNETLPGAHRGRRGGHAATSHCLCDSSLYWPTPAFSCSSQAPGQRRPWAGGADWSCCCCWSLAAPHVQDAPPGGGAGPAPR